MNCCHILPDYSMFSENNEVHGIPNSPLVVPDPGVIFYNNIMCQIRDGRSLQDMGH